MAFGGCGLRFGPIGGVALEEARVSCSRMQNPWWVGVALDAWLYLPFRLSGSSVDDLALPEPHI